MKLFYTIQYISNIMQNWIYWIHCKVSLDLETWHYMVPPLEVDSDQQEGTATSVKAKKIFHLSIGKQISPNLNLCMSFLESWACICCIFIREDKNWERNHIWIRVFVVGWLNLCKNLTTAKLLKPQFYWGPSGYDYQVFYVYMRI